MRAKQRDAVRDKTLDVYEKVSSKYPLPHPAEMYGEDGWWALTDDNLWFVVGNDEKSFAVSVNIVTDDIVLKGTTAEEFLEA